MQVNVVQFKSVTKSHVGMPHSLLKCSDVQVSNELLGLAKHFCVIFVANQMFIWLAHYIPKAFILCLAVCKEL